MRYFIVVLMIVGVASVSYARVIGDFEGASFDNFTGINSPVPVLAHVTDANHLGVTLGEQCLSVTTNGSAYWYLAWDPPSVPSYLTELKFDLTMIQSEWPNAQWTKVADKIALNSDGPDGWTEYVATGANWSWRDPTNPDPCPTDWGGWDPDALKTYTMDISDYDLTGATWLQLQISLQGGDNTGAFHFDNVQIVDVANNPTPGNEGLGFVGVTNELKWNNAVQNMSKLEVWFGEGVPMTTDANDITKDNYKDKLALIDTILNPDPNSSTAMPALVEYEDYTWTVDGYIDGPDADPNVYLGPLWTFMATNNIAPTADAGPDQYKWLNGDPNIVVTLNGTGSNDPDSGPLAMTYLWTQIAGPTVTIDTPTAATSTFTSAGDGVLASWSEAGASDPYQFQLEVDDGEFTDTDVVTVSVNSNSCTATIESGGYYFYGDIAGSGGVGDDYRDCEVDVYDLIELSLNWLGCSNVFEACD